MTFYIESIFLGIIGFIIGSILTDPGMILNPVFVWCEKHLPEWLFSPLIGCPYCMAGQYGFWYYLYYGWSKYDLFNHIFFICCAILTVEFLVKITNKLSK